MEKTYSKAKRSYTKSEAFIRQVRDMIDKVRLSPSSMWTTVSPLFLELKAYKSEEKKSAQASAIDITGDEAVVSSGQPDKGDAPQSDSDTTQRKQRSDRLILRLESLLAAYHKEIEKYEQKELSLDDLDNENSDYLMCGFLKARASKLFRRLCYLKERSAAMGGAREKKFRYTGSRYNEINLHVMRLVNKQSLDERMPDYNDIRKLVKKCDEKYNYRLGRQLLDQESKQVSWAEFF